MAAAATTTPQTTRVSSRTDDCKRRMAEPRKQHLKLSILRSVDRGLCKGMCAVDIAVAVQCTYLRSIGTSIFDPAAAPPPPLLSPTSSTSESLPADPDHLPPSQRGIYELLEEMVASKLLERVGKVGTFLTDLYSTANNFTDWTFLTDDIFLLVAHFFLKIVLLTGLFLLTLSYLWLGISC